MNYFTQLYFMHHKFISLIKICPVIQQTLHYLFTDNIIFFFFILSLKFIWNVGWWMFVLTLDNICLYLCVVLKAEFLVPKVLRSQRINLNLS